MKFVFKYILFAVLICSYSGFNCETALDRDLVMSLDQKLVLDEFRARVEKILPHEYMKQDLYLIRWLRARRFDLNSAEQMLINHLEWREENRMDAIQEEDWSEYNVLYPYYIQARDKEGKPTGYYNVGDMDLRRAVVRGESDKILRYVFKGVDEICTMARKLSEEQQNVTQAIVIINMDGYNVVTHGCLSCVRIILQAVLAIENHFNGCPDKVILINTPAIFEPILSSVRNVLSPPLNAALFVFGTDRKKWQSFIFEIIDPDQLPVEIGGSKVYAGLDYE